MMGRVASPGEPLLFEGVPWTREGEERRRMEAYQCRVLLRRQRPLLLAACLLTAAGLLCHAQSPAMPRDADPPVTMPDAPEMHAKEEFAGGVICGTVLDANGAEVEGATVMLEPAAETSETLRPMIRASFGSARLRLNRSK